MGPWVRICSVRFCCKLFKTVVWHLFCQAVSDSGEIVFLGSDTSQTLDLVARMMEQGSTYPRWILNKLMDTCGLFVQLDQIYAFLILKGYCRGRRTKQVSHTHGKKHHATHPAGRPYDFRFQDSQLFSTYGRQNLHTTNSGHIIPFAGSTCSLDYGEQDVENARATDFRRRRRTRT